MVEPRTDLPTSFDLLNDDTLRTTLKFVGKSSYRSFGGVNKRCKEVYLATKGMKKKTFLFGYGPLSRITDRIERSNMENNRKLRLAVGIAVAFYNRKDVMDWALEEKNTFTLRGICFVAGVKERFDLLEEIFNGVGDWDEKVDVFKGLGLSAVRSDKLNVLEWLETHQLDIDKKMCAEVAAQYGHLHILQWLREETGLELDEILFIRATTKGGQLNVMKWLREQEVDWHEFTFHFAAKNTGNVAILQWLHDEGCPWERRLPLSEEGLEPDVLDWLRVNGYVN